MGFEVAYDPSNNIKIVKMIEKYPVLYNFKKYPLVEYREPADNAWTLAANELGVSGKPSQPIKYRSAANSRSCAHLQLAIIRYENQLTPANNLVPLECILQMFVVHN